MMSSAGAQDSSKPHVCVCICTYKRRELLSRLLDKLQAQETDGRFTFSAVVADNDVERSAESLVAEFRASSQLEIVYCSEPRKNIALVRNKAIAHARGRTHSSGSAWRETLRQWCRAATNASATALRAAARSPVSA